MAFLSSHGRGPGNDAGFLWFARNLALSFLVIHQVALWGLAYAGGHLLRACVRKGKWDLKTWVDALMPCGNSLFLYSGVLLDYELNDRGGLGSISLIEPEVRRLDEVGTTGEPLPESRPVEPCSVFGISAERILNTNITYLAIPPESPTGQLLSEFLDVEAGESHARPAATG